MVTFYSIIILLRKNADIDARIITQIVESATVLPKLSDATSLNSRCTRLAGAVNLESADG